MAATEHLENEEEIWGKMYENLLGRVKMQQKSGPVQGKDQGKEKHYTAQFNVSLNESKVLGQSDITKLPFPVKLEKEDDFKEIFPPGKKNP